MDPANEVALGLFSWGAMASAIPGAACLPVLLVAHTQGEAPRAQLRHGTLLALLDLAAPLRRTPQNPATSR